MEVEPDWAIIWWLWASAAEEHRHQFCKAVRIGPDRRAYGG